MTSPAETGPAEATLVDGIDIDAAAAAVRGCPAVDDLDAGLLGGVGTYLPGRRVPGIRIDGNRVEVHVRGVWNQPVGVVAEQIRHVLAGLVGGRAVDVVLTDIAEPGQAEPGALSVAADGSVGSWTSPSASGGPSVASSSAPTTPTVAEIRPSS